MVCFLVVFFFGFLRSGEATISKASSYDPAAHLNFNDISTDNPHSPNIIRVCIKTSKTDPFRHGVNVHIGRTNNYLCPVSAMLFLLYVELLLAYYFTLKIMHL